MLIARVKKETNIVEYLLYMFQIEDIIRSLKFDIDQIDRLIVQEYDQPEKVKQEVKAWYQELIREMQSEAILQSGHLKRLTEIIDGLYVLHQTLLTTIQDKKYQKFYEMAKTPLKELVQRSGGKSFTNEIEIALNGMYGLLVLRLKKENISEETNTEMVKISQMLAHLAHQYQQMKMGKLNLSDEKNN